MRRMSPNQSGTNPAAEGGDHAMLTNGQEVGATFRTAVVTSDEDSLLTTDCARVQEPIKLKQSFKNKRKTSEEAVPEQKILNSSPIKTHCDDEEGNLEDDRSSVVTESSLSDCGEEYYDEDLRSKADTLAVAAINSASDDFQSNKTGVICVNSELQTSVTDGPREVPATTRGEVVVAGRANNGYVMSEVGKPSRSRQLVKRNDKELALNGTHNNQQHQLQQQLVDQSTMVAPLGPQPTTAIFNESSDITLGNKTFITGSVTIKQYIKDGGQNKLTNGADEPPTLWDSWSTRKKAMVLSGASFLIAAIIAVVVVLSTVSDGQSEKEIGDGDDPSRYDIPINSTIGNDLRTNGSVLRIVARPHWIAQPPNQEGTKLLLPVKRVIIAHTVTENCTTQSSCVFQVRQIQTYHMESLNFDDIGYNFLVGGDGAVYEGRGWDKQGAHTRGYNMGSICIAFIGTFTKYEPPQRQLNAAKLLMEEGVRLKKLDKNYKVYGHRQLYATESPGSALYQLITKWDHWADDI